MPIMTKSPQVHAMIVAAGRGSRFGASIPKQYIIIDGQTLLQHSVARLSKSDDVAECLLVIAPDDDTAQDLSFDLPTWFAVGGSERWHSVRAGVEAIIDRGAHDDDLILIHDAARPSVPCADIDNVIKAAKLEPYGAILGAPVADTLKQSHTQDSDEASPCYIARTVNREHIWQAQTPQVFRVGSLNKVLGYIDRHNISITDEASAFEHLNLPVRIVTGSRQNIKLTFADDAVLISSVLQAQSTVPMSLKDESK